MGLKKKAEEKAQATFAILRKARLPTLAWDPPEMLSY